MYNNIINKLPDELKKSIENLPESILNSLEEIRLKAGKPALIYAMGKEYEIYFGTKKIVDYKILNNIFNSILNYSVYAYQDELSNGYITIEGGHRAGICGKVVLENEKIKTIKDISSINIRRSKEIIGVSNPYMKYLFDDRGRPFHTILVSPPKCGKTTLLRDIIRNFSNKGFKTGVVDERSEIAGMFAGVSSYDLGLRTDILDGCPKEKGIIMLIRSMSPDIIATDEIGKHEDSYAIETALSAGVKLLTTIHGNDYEDLCRSGIKHFIEKGVFQRFIFLSNRPHTGHIDAITDGMNRSLLT